VDLSIELQNIADALKDIAVANEHIADAINNLEINR